MGSISTVCLHVGFQSPHLKSRFGRSRVLKRTLLSQRINRRRCRISHTSTRLRCLLTRRFASVRQPLRVSRRRSQQVARGLVQRRSRRSRGDGRALAHLPVARVTEQQVIAAHAAQRAVPESGGAVAARAVAVAVPSMPCCVRTRGWAARARGRVSVPPWEAKCGWGRQVDRTIRCIRVEVNCTSGRRLGHACGVVEIG